MSNSLCAGHAMSVFKNSCLTPAPLTASGSPNPEGDKAKTALSSAAALSYSLPNLSHHHHHHHHQHHGKTKTSSSGAGAEENWAGPAVPRPPKTIRVPADVQTGGGDDADGAENGVNRHKSTAEVLCAQKKQRHQRPPRPGGSEDDYAALFQTLLESNSLLHKEIGRLRRDHKKAMAKLTSFSSSNNSSRQGWANDESGSGRRGARPRPREVSMKNKGTSTTSTSDDEDDKDDDDDDDDDDDCCGQSVVYDTPEEFHYDNSNSESDSDALSVRSMESYQMTCISPDSASSAEEEEVQSSQFKSPGGALVARMWDGFSVEDYPIEDFSQAFLSESDKTKARKKQPTHRITIPQPFSMTLREEKAPRRKTKSMMIVEKEQEEKEATAQSESRKKFRATPIPANTFLPLYDLINAKNEQRRELVRKMSSSILKSTQKPFNFSKRDEERRQHKDQWVKHEREQEIAQHREKVFKAKPVPHNLLDPEVDAEHSEKEEYRKIRIRMRAEELLKNSKFPCSSAPPQNNFKLTSQNNARHAHKGMVRPTSTMSRVRNNPRRTHQIPDYEKAYFKLQHQLLLKKQSKLTTVSEPFQLHTEKRAKAPRTKPAVDNGPPSPSPEVEKEKLDKVLNPPPYPPVMTETVRRRLLLTQERLAEALERTAVLEDEEKARKRREKTFQKIVAKKSSELDVTALLEEKKKIKQEAMRQKEKEKELQYRQHLDTIKERVSARPLLLEQQASQVKDLARANYIAALRTVGFADEEIEALLQDICK